MSGDTPALVIGLREDSLESELGAFTLASSWTPIPRVSTNSPPSHPVTRARAAPVTESATAAEPGQAGVLRRLIQLAANRPVTTKFPTPCSRPILLARVRGGMLK